MNLRCVLCRAQFAGTPEEQVALFNAHPCNKVEQLRRAEIAAARKRHPSARQHTMNVDSSTISTIVSIAALFVVLVAVNWLLGEGARHISVVAAITVAVTASFVWLVTQMSVES